MPLSDCAFEGSNPESFEVDRFHFGTVKEGKK